MGQESICGLAIEIDCPNLKITEVASLEFQLWFIDSFASLLQSSKDPSVAVSLFDHKENVPTSVAVIPIDVSDLHQTESSKTFQIRLALLVNETATVRAYALIVQLAKLCINVTRILSSRKNLTYRAKFSINNSKEASILLTLTKTV